MKLFQYTTSDAYKHFMQRLSKPLKKMTAIGSFIFKVNSIFLQMLLTKPQEVREKEFLIPPKTNI